MPIDPLERVALGRTGLEVTRLALGGASIGGLFSAVDDEVAIGTVRHAWDLGIRAYDTAPLYGYGASERRMGRALRDRPREEYVLSTKVGRLVRHESAIDAGADVDRQRLGTEDDAYYVRGNPCASCSTTARTAWSARSKRASSASVSTASTSR